MENRERLILEISIAVVFILILIFSGIILAENKDEKDGDSGNYIINSYNSYVTYPVEIVEREVSNYNYDYVVYRKKEFEFEKNWDYSYYSKVTSDPGFLGTRVKNYKVYVYNKESVEAYFKVNYYFEDCHGRDFSETITEYVGARDREEFVYRNVETEKEICSWKYSVKKLNF